MITLVFAVPEPEGGADMVPTMRTILEEVKPKLDSIPGVKGYAANEDVADQIVSLVSGDAQREDGNLVSHARRELELIEEEPDVIDWYLNVIRAFASFEHSGGSASVAIPVINELLQFKNLRPITDNPEDWIDVADNVWQCRRNGALFSEDGGKTFYDVNGTVRVMYTSAQHTVEESDETSVRGGSGEEPAPDEHEFEDARSISEQDAPEVEAEGTHGI